MIKYRPDLKQIARKLRSSLTDAEHLLWSRLRKKQIAGVQFYRQKPVGEYVVDFYAARVKLVVEVDGSQHYEPTGSKRDQRRDEFLRAQGLEVLPFNNLQVLQETDAVLVVILDEVNRRLNGG